MIESGSHTTNEYHLVAADTPAADFKLIAPRLDDQEYYPEHRDGILYIRTNDTGRNFRLVTAPVSTPDRENWTELFAVDEKAPLEDFDLFQTFLVTSRRELGLPVMDVYAFGEGIPSMNPSSRPERSEAERPRHFGRA
jgi:oligopeptidase B